MTNRNDWIPVQEGKFVDFLALWITILGDTSIQTAYGWDAAVCSALLGLITAFTDARTAYEVVDSTANHIKKNEAKADCIAAVRAFARESIRFNTKITDDVKKRLGIRITDTDPTPTKAADAGPTSKVLNDNKRPGVVVIRYLGAKPKGALSCHITFGRYGAGDTLPRTVNALPLGDSFTHNPWEYTFPQDASGDKFFYALRWGMSGGTKSPWSAIAECVIP
jgi:hypothetical protein